MRVGLVAIATGEAYRDYARNLHKSSEKFFPEAEFILFSDHDRDPGVNHWFYTPAKGYPNETLFRYSTLLSKKFVLEEYDQLFYADADMEFVAPATSNIYSNGITATLHPGFFARNRKGTPETRPNSLAYCTTNTAYYCGGFQGGNARSYLTAASELATHIRLDEQKSHIVAVWHDESHWNRYLADNLPEKVLSPSYCFPEDYDGSYGWSKETYPPILVALDKRKRGNHPRYQ